MVNFTITLMLQSYAWIEITHLHAHQDNGAGGYGGQQGYGAGGQDQQGYGGGYGGQDQQGGGGKAQAGGASGGQQSQGYHPYKR